MREFLARRKLDVIGVSLAVILGAGLIVTERTVFRPRRNQSICQSNLKNIGLGTMQYVRDWDEEWPLARNWQKGLWPYTKSETIFHCPARPDLISDYAYNKRIADLQKLSRVVSAAAEVLVFESNAGKINASDYGTSLPKTARHPGGTNIVYADGHVKARRTLGFRKNFDSLKTQWRLIDIQDIKNDDSLSNEKKQEMLGWLTPK